MDSNRVPAHILDEAHARDISLSIADEDHPGERHGALLHRLVGIDSRRVPDIKAPLVDAEEELRLGRVVYRHGGPLSDAVLVIEKRGGVDRLELFPDPTSLDHLLDARGDDVVLELHALGLSKAVYPSEPGLHAGEEPDAPSMFPERLTGQLHPIVHAGLPAHQEHVAEDGIGILILGQIQRHLPEMLRLHPELRDVAVLLHVARTERPVEVVAEGNPLHKSFTKKAT